MEGFVGERERRSLARRRTRLRLRSALTAKLNPPSSHWLGNVLEGLRPKVITGDLDLASDLPIGIVRHANSAGLSNALQARDDVDAVVEDAARRITRSAPKRGASCRTTRIRSRRGRASEYAVNLGGHDEVVLMQSLDLLGLQRDRRIAPTEADIRMMAFGFREFTNLLNKGKRLPEIAKPEAPLDAVSFLRQLPVWDLCMKELSLLARE